MRSIGGICCVVASLVATPVLAKAQRCTGTATFADGHLRAHVGTSTVSEWRYNDIGLSIGRERGLFATGGASRGTYKGVDITDNGLSASVGYQVRIGSRLQLCPQLYVGRSTSTWIYGGTHFDYWSTATGLSTAIGLTAWSSRRFDLVPSAVLAYTRSSARAQSARQGIEREAEGSRRAGALLLSSGLIFHKILTVKPFVSIPVGYTGGKNVTGFSIAVSFGSRD